MPTRNVHLTQHFDEFIEAGIASGRFGNASEIVREGLRLLEQREEEDRAKIEWLRAAVQEGIDSLDRGDGLAFESMDALEEYMNGVWHGVKQERARALQSA